MRGTVRRRASDARLFQFVQAADEIFDVASRKGALAFFGFNEPIAPFGAHRINADLRMGDDLGQRHAHQIADGTDFESKANRLAHEIGHRRAFSSRALAQGLGSAVVDAEGLADESHGIAAGYWA